MNELQRAVLMDNTRCLVSDIFITDTLLTSMQQRKIFDQEMIEIIKVQKTQREQVHKVLELLPRRGPDAFDNFVAVLQEDYPWLAVQLGDAMQTELNRLEEERQEHERLEQERQKQDKLETGKQEREKLDAEKQEDETQDPEEERNNDGQEKPITLSLKQEKDSTDSVPVSTPRLVAEVLNLDHDIRTRVSAYVQRQFGQVRRIANTDKKSIERWMTEWLQSERRRLKTCFDAMTENQSEEDILEHPDVKDRLFAIHRKLEPCLKNGYYGNMEGSDEDEDEDSHTTSENMNFDLIMEEVAKVTSKTRALEGQATQCMVYLGDQQTDLSVQVHNLCSMLREKQNELENERHKIESILVELYNYSTKTNKLQMIVGNKENEILQLKQQVNKQRAENVELINEITELERTNMMHLEKEAVINELRQTKQDLNTMMKAVVNENTDLKQQLARNVRMTTRGFQGRRQSNATINNGQNRQKVTPRKRNNLYTTKPS